jgi:hypothetical protein
MKLSSINSIVKYLAVIIVIFTINLSAQISASAGADLVSRYIWRGLEINKGPNIQPAIAFGAGGLEVGLWGSHSLSFYPGVAYPTEIDLYASYGFSTEAGDISLLITDYYFPDSGIPLGWAEDGTGAHTLEVGAGYSGTESFPLSVSLYYNFYNDPGNNLYFEFGYPFVISGIDFGLIVGGTPGSEDNPVYYGTDELALINVGISASKEVKITEDFSLPLSSSFIVNPNADIAYFVFGCSFSL